MSFDTADLRGRAQDLQNAYDQVVANHNPGAAGQNAGIPTKTAGDVTGIYDDFLITPDPSSFTYPIGQLTQVMDKLAPEGYADDAGTKGAPDLGLANPRLAGIGTSADYVSTWTGDAAQIFKSTYADKFIPVVSNQFAVAANLRNAINAEAAVWQTARDDLDKLSADAIEQMKHVDDCSQDDWESGLAIFGAVVAVAAAPLTGGTSLEIALGVVGAGISVAGTGVAALGGGGQLDSQGLANGSPEEIISSLQNRLMDIKTHIHDQESKIVDALSTTQVELYVSKDKWTLPEPKLATATKDNVDHRGYGGHDA